MSSMGERVDDKQREIERMIREIPYEKLPEGQKHIADIIGVENTIRLCEEYGGSRNYMPGNQPLKRYLRDLDIHEAFYGKGMSASKIARQYRIAVRTVERIVGKRLEDLKP